MAIEVEEDWLDIDTNLNHEIENIFPSRHKFHRHNSDARSAVINNPNYEGVYRLMQALLKEAVICYKWNVRGKTERGRRLFEEVAAWVEGAETQFPVFNFETVCDVVGIDAQMLRAKLRALKE
jgi:hypothetical protein